MGSCSKVTQHKELMISISILLDFIWNVYLYFWIWLLWAPHTVHFFGPGEVRRGLHRHCTVAQARAQEQEHDIDMTYNQCYHSSYKIAKSWKVRLSNLNKVSVMFSLLSSDCDIWTKFRSRSLCYSLIVVFEQIFSHVLSVVLVFAASTYVLALLGYGTKQLGRGHTKWLWLDRHDRL